MASDGPPSTSQPLETRFWAKVEKGCEPPEHVRDELAEDCWEWAAATDPAGYGRIWANGRNESAHRVSMFLAGHDVGGEWVLHHCDNPPCVNPAHLYLGDQSDNAQDAIERTPERVPYAPGEDHWHAKLTDDDVRELRERCAAGETRSDLADAFGISRSNVCHIVTGESRQSAGGPIQDPIDDGRGKTKLTDDDAREIRERCAAGEARSDLADAFGISEGHVSHIVRGETHQSAGGPIQDDARAKLTDEDVRELRERCAAGETRSTLADAFGISRSHVATIVTGAQRQSAGGPIQDPIDMDGESNPNAKLSDDDVRQIRERYASAEDVTQADLADEFGVDRSNVGHIVTGEQRQSAGGPIQEPVDDDRGKTKLTDDDAREIRERYASGDVNQYDLADEFDVSRSQVGHIVRGEHHQSAGGPIHDPAGASVVGGDDS